MIIKCILDTRRITDDKHYPVKIRITHQRKTVYYGLGIYTEESEFDSRTGIFYTDSKNTKNINIQNNKRILFYIQKCNDIIYECAKNNEYLDAAKLKRLLLPVSNESEVETRALSREEVKRIENSPITLQQCFADCINNREGRTKESFKTTLNKINNICGDVVFVKDINENWLREFDHLMAITKTKKGKVELDGLSVNGRSIHMKNLRTVFNYAIEKKIISQDNYPFKFFKIETEETIKRAMKTDDLQTLLSYTGDEKENMVIDVCKMIFFGIGINLKDLHELEDFNDESLTYRRAKTGRLYNIFIHKELRVLLDKYKSKDGGLVFKHNYGISWFNKVVNSTLEDICAKIKIKTITTYALRHSWATYASKLGASKDEISKALGHGAKSVTDVYIDYDMEKIKEINRKVIDYVMYPSTKK